MNLTPMALLRRPMALLPTEPPHCFMKLSCLPVSGNMQCPLFAILTTECPHLPFPTPLLLKHSMARNLMSLSLEYLEVLPMFTFRRTRERDLVPICRRQFL